MNLTPFAWPTTLTSNESAHSKLHDIYWQGNSWPKSIQTTSRNGGHMFRNQLQIIQSIFQPIKFKYFSKEKTIPINWPAGYVILFVTTDHTRLGFFGCQPDEPLASLVTTNRIINVYGFIVVIMLLMYSVLHCLYFVGNKIITTTRMERMKITYSCTRFGVPLKVSSGMSIMPLEFRCLKTEGYSHQGYRLDKCKIYNNRSVAICIIT